jgi:hypothetical protein
MYEKLKTDKISKLLIVSVLMLSIQSCDTKPNLNKIPEYKPESPQHLNFLLNNTSKNSPKSLYEYCKTNYKINRAPICITVTFIDGEKTYRVDLPAFETDQDFNQKRLKNKDYYIGAVYQKLQSNNPLNMNLKDLKVYTDYTEVQKYFSPSTSH